MTNEKSREEEPALWEYWYKNYEGDWYRATEAYLDGKMPEDAIWHFENKFLSPTILQNVKDTRLIRLMTALMERLEKL